MEQLKLQNKIKIVTFICIIINCLSCKPEIYNCNQLLNCFYLKGFKEVTTKNLKITKINLGSLSNIGEYEISEYTDNQGVVFEIKFKTFVLTEKDSLMLSIADESYLLSDIKTIIEEKHMMIGTSKECLIKSYKLNGELKNNSNLDIYRLTSYIPQ